METEIVCEKCVSALYILPPPPFPATSCYIYDLSEACLTMESLQHTNSSIPNLLRSRKEASVIEPLKLHRLLSLLLVLSFMLSRRIYYMNLVCL